MDEEKKNGHHHEPAVRLSVHRPTESARPPGPSIVNGAECGTCGFAPLGDCDGGSLHVGSGAHVQCPHRAAYETERARVYDPATGGWAPFADGHVYRELPEK